MPSRPFRYADIDLPAHLQVVADDHDNTPADNPITDAGATLGRVLFYDKRLSRSKTTSCASCHLQEFAFAENRALSVGFAGETVTRNSMSLVNLRYYRPGKFFWDHRADSLEAQVLMPIENPIEMGHRLDILVDQLQATAFYQPLFESAFGESAFGESVVTKDRIAKALAQFVRSIVSYRSRYDMGRAQVASVLEPFPNFTEQENFGKEQFFGRARCAQCHLPSDGAGQQSAFFQLSKPAANGVDSDDASDLGLAEHTGRLGDRGKFKASTLRNIELTAPYMHDGRFKTLDSVIEHYNWSVRPHQNLDPILQDFVSGLALPEVPKVALAAFLLTLTDHELIRDPRFSDPFVK